MSDPIVVTQPSLVSLDAFARQLEPVWQSGIMTHNGPVMQELERALSKELQVPDVVCLANGTCALQLAIRALDLQGEILTTPFSYVATASVIAWERCRPVFVDIDPRTWNIDAEKIEEKITDKTVAILPVHVFSRPCDTVRIDDIARRHDLPVIYDAAHAMSVDHQGQSLLLAGTVSCVSFHATKLFNTSEGGACVSHDADLLARIRRMRFFGFNEQKEIVDIGMNAKMTEVEAALGMANLGRHDEVRQRRKQKYELYLDGLSGASFVTFQDFEPESYNYSYMPVVFDSEERSGRVVSALEAEQIVPRRYFHPSLNTVPVFAPQESLPVSERIAATILCLPLYDTLADDDIVRICRIVASC